MTTATPKNVVFVCRRNAGKSQLAAALMRSIAGLGVTVVSAGTSPGDALNSESVASLAELGIDVGSEHPKVLTGGMIAAADVIVVLGREARVEVHADGPRLETWLTQEPSDAGITGMERMRLIRDEIRARVDDLNTRL